MKDGRPCSHCVAENRRMRRRYGHSWCKAAPSRRIGLPFPEGRGCRLFQERDHADGHARRSTSVVSILHAQPCSPGSSLALGASRYRRRYQ